MTKINESLRSIPIHKNGQNTAILGILNFRQFSEQPGLLVKG
jgi:hypothetical protein